MALKKQLINFFRSVSPYIPFQVLKSASQQHFFAPFYHSISDEVLPHIKNLYQVRSTKQFKKDLSFLLQHFEPIGLTDLIEYYQQHQSLPKNRFWLSFDDGLSECATVIAPILKQMGIPATFFLNSAFIDNKALMFRYKASLLIEQLSHTPADISKCASIAKQHNIQWSSPQKTLLAIRWPNQSCLDNMLEACGISIENFLLHQQPYLTTLQIKAMQADGFSFGSHSIDHPKYNLLPLEQQLNQTIDCQRILEQQLNLKHKVFAFPFTDFGVSSDFFTKLHQHESFDFTFGGAGLKHEKIHRQLQRFPMETNQEHSVTRLLHTEYLYYCLKKLVNKNTINRH